MWRSSHKNPGFSISQKDARFKDAYTFQHDGLTCLLFPTKENMELDLGKFAVSNADLLCASYFMKGTYHDADTDNARKESYACLSWAKCDGRNEAVTCLQYKPISDIPVDRELYVRIPAIIWKTACYFSNIIRLRHTADEKEVAIMQNMVPLYGFGGGGGGETGATLTVTTQAGCTVTVSKDGKTKTKVADASGVAVFNGLSTGEWTVIVSIGTDTTEDTVYIDADYTKEISFVKIYGIYRDITASSPVWAREDDAAEKTATASVGTVAGHSDFDTCYPWSGIQRETLSTGDVMVKIPKFWFRRYRDGNIEHIKIADKSVDGFTLHPAFNHAGVEKDCVYVGAYKTASDNNSVSGVIPGVSLTRAASRSNAKSKGAGWGLFDISALSAIQMLMLVEFATNDMQSAIGRGYCDGNSAATSTGSCDIVASLTGRPAGTDGQVNVVWRGIEGLWGNVWEWVDGVNWQDGTYYVCNDPSKYADDTAENYTALSFHGTTTWTASSVYITEEGIDTGNNEHIMLPAAAGSGSESTYYCDICRSGTGWRVYRVCGRWSSGSNCGLFTAHFGGASSDPNTDVGSRLLYIPQ